MTPFEKRFRRGVATEEEMLRYIDEASEQGLPCEYGHLGCAAVEGGLCSNEVWVNTDEYRAAAAEAASS